MRGADSARASRRSPKAAIALVLAASCAAAVAVTEPNDPADRIESSHDRCDVGAVRLTQAFPGSPGHACSRIGSAKFRLIVAPEAPDINPSPWYAFDLHGVRSATTPAAQVVLSYTESGHRYRPKRRTPSGRWQAIPESAVDVDEDGSAARLRIDLAASGLHGPLRVAAQEVLDVSERRDWRSEFAERAGFALSVIGHSVGGRPIESLHRPASADDPALVVVLGGQHPPEVPGVLGLRAFLESLIRIGGASSDWMQRIEWLVIPNLNPDGVDAGHWRLNAGDVDLNRDWGPFTQPETRAALEAISSRVEAGSRPVLLLDFHATRRDVLYLPEQSPALDPTDFAGRWARSIRAKMPAGSPGFAQSRNHGRGRPTAKTWFADTYGRPGITVEFGDETDRSHIDRLGAAAAEALFEVLSADGH